MKPELKEDVEVERQRRTLFLLIGGALSLLLPLLGVAYIKYSETTVSEPGGEGAVFAPHEVGSMPVALPKTMPAAPLPAPAAASKKTMTPVGAGSLGFVRGGSDYAQPDAAPAAAQAQQPQASPSPSPTPAPKTVASSQPPPAPAKRGPKPFVMPKLKPTNGFTSMGSKPQAGQQGAQGGTPDIQALMKNMPAGAGAPGGGQGGMPDMSGLMKNMPGGGGAPGGGQGMPDIGAMMKNIPGGGQGTPDVNQMIQNMPQGQPGGQGQ